MKYEEIRNYFKKELDAVDFTMQMHLKSDINIIEDASKYVTSYTGKRIRPIITLLFSKILKTDIKTIIEIASAIELIHTATLLHDDVIDLSEKRRGKLSINKIWGNKEAILIGDFLYTKSFEIMVKSKNLKLLKHMAKTTNIISAGEILQLVNKNNFEINTKDYLKIIKYKTARLFASSASIACIIKNEKNFKNIFEYGMFLGMAYQLIDDLLDYESDDEKFGKNTFDDILNGTFTLPLIHALNKNENIKNKIKTIIKKKDIKKTIEIKNIIIEAKSLDYTKNIALHYIKKSKEAINKINITDNIHKNMASSLLDFITQRNF